jgi:hypothetical protein
LRGAWLLKRKIARHQGEQIVDEYESGAEWEAALERRQAALTVALKEAGLENFKIPSRRGPRGMKAKRREFIGRYQARFAAIEAELERRGLRIRQTFDGERDMHEASGFGSPVWKLSRISGSP